MQREALTRGKYSTKTINDLSSSFWTYRIEQVVKSAQKRKKSFLDKDPKQKRIAFITERQLVFTYLEERETFKKRAPKIIMDEADISYNRGTPYEQERSAFYYTPEEITESTSIWLMNYIIAQHIKSDDFITYAGRTSLKPESLERICSEIILKKIFRLGKQTKSSS